MSATAPPPTSAQRRALSLPEILRMIFEDLRGLASLGAAARVCRAWFHAAVPVLWRAPQSTAFASVSGADGLRRQFYARHVRQLIVGDTEDLAAWFFPAVTELYYDFHHRGLDEKRLQHLLACCGPTLVAVEIGADCRKFYAYITLDGRQFEDLLRPAALALVATRPGLRRFFTSCIVLDEDVEMLAASPVTPPATTIATTTATAAPANQAIAPLQPQPQPPPQPFFGQLRALSLSIFAAHVPTLVALLDAHTAVSALSLRVLSAGASVSFWGALGWLASLRELCVDFVRPLAFSTAADFLELGRLPRELRALRVLVGECPESAPAAVTVAEHWRAVAARLPRLEALCLYVRGQLRGDVLRVLGEEWRGLRELRLPYVPCDLTELDRSTATVLFPCLRELDVDTFTGFERMGLALANCLRRQFSPKLRFFTGIDLLEVQEEAASVGEDDGRKDRTLPLLRKQPGPNGTWPIDPVGGFQRDEDVGYDEDDDGTHDFGYRCGCGAAVLGHSNGRAFAGDDSGGHNSPIATGVNEESVAAINAVPDDAHGCLRRRRRRSEPDWSAMDPVAMFVDLFPDHDSDGSDMTSELEWDSQSVTSGSNDDQMDLEEEAEEGAQEQQNDREVHRSETNDVEALVEKLAEACVE